MKNRYLNLVSLFWFLKFIFDMFYLQKIFTISITVFALLLFIFTIRNTKIKFKLVDLFAIIMVLLFTLSFFKSTAYYIDYLKILSAFILYFLGRLLFANDEKVSKTITYSLFIVFIINLIVCLIGKGSLTWGNSNTLRGLYYFKTDFACMLVSFLVFWLWNYNKSKLIKCLIVFITLGLIILANARIYYLIAALILIMYLFYTKNKKIFSLKTAVTLLISIVVVIFGIQLMSNLSIFRERNLISLDINSYDDLLNASNTQGRNVVWEVLLRSFNNQNLLTRTFGTGLSFYKDYGYKGFTEHSTYIKVLLNTGYVGIIIFTLFIINIFNNISKVKNKKIEYISFLLLITFLISGISSPTLLYVNTSWLPMFYSGLCVSYSGLVENGEEDEK
ncbi:MAG: O-antigen ligase family protein [Bacilli bacterium]|nr:O-antigen ligase family protein [Bacilli bacterium]